MVKVSRIVRPAMASFFGAKPSLVVGGGDTALEDALYLAKITKKVYLIHRRDAFRGSRILQQRVLAEPRIEIIYNAVVTKINADTSGVNGISLKDTRTGAGREVDIEGVFIFVGFVPNNQLVPAGISMNTSGYAIADENVRQALLVFLLWATPPEICQPDSTCHRRRMHSGTGYSPYEKPGKMYRHDIGNGLLLVA